MPELPEVETTLRGIAPHIVGQDVTTVTVRQSRLRWPIPADLPALLCGGRISRVARRAKYLLLYLPQGVLILHLGMSGSLRILTRYQEPGKHDHLDIGFSNGVFLRLTDPRRFGAALWTDTDPDQHALLRNLGPEPLLEEFDGHYLYRQSRGRRVAVKQFIMDSHVVVGVGNIYANEALFAAGISPRRAAGRVSLARYQQLAHVIREVLANAIAHGGTTLRDFLGSEGKPGYFRQELKAYGRGGEPCVSCGSDLKEVRMGQRTTVYCNQCQR